MKPFLLFTIAFLQFSAAFGQYNPIQIRNEVIEKEIIDSIFVFHDWRDGKDYKTELEYLGKITTKNGRIFKIMNSTYVFAWSGRHYVSILIFNELNQYVGEYCGVIAFTANRVEGSMLIFDKLPTYCKCIANRITSIDLSNGLPNSFEVVCSPEEYLFYQFGSYPNEYH